MPIEPLQTTYRKRLDPFMLGQIPDMRTPGRDISRNCEPAAGIPFGSAVAQGTADRQCRALATGQGTKYLGVAVLDKTTNASDRYQQYQAVRVRNEGPVVVRASVTVAAGDPAFVIPATGFFTNVATGNTPVGMFETSGAANALVIINLK